MKKLMIFLMIAIPLVIIILINFTVDVVIGNVSISVDRIELDREEVFANIDDNLSLNATIYPSNATNQEIIWKSTNESVAIVDLNGNVSFVGFGNGYITATTVDGNKMASCYFYVTDTVVHEVILTSPKQEVHIGTSVQLTVTVLPNEALNKNVTFVSSNSEIASVDQNGKVTGLQPSIKPVTISAISEDGGHVGSVSLLITKPVEELKLASEGAVTAEDTYKIGWEILPTDASNKSVIFNVDNPDVATVDSSGIVTFKTVGEVNVDVITVDGGFTKTINIVYTAGYAQSLTLKQYMISAMINDSPQYIDYTVIPNSIPKTEVTFSSSNEEVAYVSNGHLYFVGGGNATITVKVEKAENQFIQQQIMVYVESPAQDIIIEDIVTAEKTVQLQPKSYPENSTNEKFFYYSNNPLVTVNSEGLVTFNTNSAMTAKIKIYANEDFSNVSKEINVEYTAGRAKEFNLKSEEISFNYGQSSQIEYSIFPANADTSKINLSIVSQKNNSGNGDVVQILADGSLRGVGGGVATIEVSLVMLGGQTEVKTLTVNIIRQVQDIDLSLDLQQKEGVFVTAENKVNFAGTCLPEDATNKNISWSVSDHNIAVVLDNVLTFNQTGTVKLIASTPDGFTKEFNIQYTGSYPLSAEVGVLIDEEVFDIPNSINVGQSFEIVIKDIFPSNTINKSIFLKVSNQSTASLNGKVLAVEGNTFVALAGGTATLTVYISTLILNFDIEVVQMPQEISVSPANIQTTNSSLQLIATVLPVDTTNKEVMFEVLNDEIAYIEGNTLYFKQDGVAEIVVTSLADPLIKYSFTIEKIAKGAGSVDPTQDEVEMYVDDSIKLDFSSQGISYDHIDITVVKGEEDGIISLGENNIVTALAEGQAEIRCDLYDNYGSQIKSYNIIITVYQRVTEILYKGDLEIYNNYYTTARNIIDLQAFKTSPEGASSKLEFEIVQAYNSSGVSSNIAQIEDNCLRWLASGTLVLKVIANNGDLYRTFNFKYTGGDALSAELNIENEISLSEGDSVKIEVKKWIPADATNTQIFINEISHTAGVSVIDIDSETMTITALNGGYSQIVVELSSGITKQIRINVVEFVSSIEIDQDNIITASNVVTINARALPSSATNRTLTYSMPEVSFATLKNNVVTFTKAGTVVVSIATTDGSNIVKNVTVTSTMGYLHSIELNVTSKTLNKNSSFSLYVKQTYPLDAIYNEVTFKIFSQQTSDNSQNNVITLSENGLVTACYGGTAIIRAYSINGEGQEVYTDCYITVNTPVSDISIEFEDEIEYYQNSIITSKNELHFRQTVYPADATNQEFIYQISDNKVATVENGIIRFLKTGNVTITFISAGNNNKSEVYSFYYVGDTLIEATLDTSLFDGKTLNLNSGDVYKPTLKTQIPKDNLNVNISISNIVENRNHNELQVISFRDGKIFAENGGSVTFDLYANDIFLGNYTIIVYREVEKILADNEDVNYVGTNYFKLNCQVYPLDATDRVFVYSSSNTQIADVDDKGNVVFYKTGRVVITVKIKNHENIQTQVVVEYTKEIKGISIEDTRTEMYVGESVTFGVIPYPLDAEDFTVNVYLLNNNIATLTQVGNKYRLTGKRAGQVEIVVKVNEKDLEYRKTFTYYTKLSDIILELDNIKDANGYGGYRVFGNYFISNNTFTNTYQMVYSTLPSNSETNYSELITWSTSDPTIATVDENGLVRFLNIGEVTITASQKQQFEGANVISKSYTFTVVNGINIYTSQELDFARLNFGKISKENTRSYLVLHNNIVVNKPSSGGFYLYENIHGNGYMLDFSTFNSYYKVEIKPKENEALDLVFDNVIFRGVSFENGELDELENEGVLITIYDNCSKVLFYNCVIENAMNLVEVFGSNVEFKGCILRNSFSAGLLLTRNKNSNYIPNVVVEDCIFSRSLLSAIVFSPDKSDNLKGYESKLKLVGHVKIYNWLTMDEFQVDPFIKYFENYGAGSVAKDVINQIKNNITNNYPTYKYTYQGKEYYHFGILKIYAKAAGIVEFKSNGIIDRSQLINQYIEGDIKGSASASITGIPLPVTLEYTFNMTNYNNQNPAIKPGDTYEGNQSVMAEIIQPKKIIF